MLWLPRPPTGEGHDRFRQPFGGRAGTCFATGGCVSLLARSGSIATTAAAPAFSPPRNLGRSRPLSAALLHPFRSDGLVRTGTVLLRRRAQLPLAGGDPPRRSQLREPQRAPYAQGADRGPRRRRPRDGRRDGERVPGGALGGRADRRGAHLRHIRPPRSSRSREPDMPRSRCSTPLAHHGIPHRVLGSLGLYERTEVRDALAYLTLLSNPRDAHAFARAIGSPRRGAGPATVSRMVACGCERHGGHLIAASAHARELRRMPSEAARERLAEFGGGLEHIRRELQAGRSLGHLTIATVHSAGRAGPPLRAAARRRSKRRAPRGRRTRARGPPLALPRRAIFRSATLSGLLEHAAGLHARELDALTDHRITVSTIHRAKGAEAQLVVLLACEEQLLPSWRSLSSPGSGALEEERRLFYVAATRAKDWLLITHAAERGRRPRAAHPGSSWRPACSRGGRPSPRDHWSPSNSRCASSISTPSVGRTRRRADERLVRIASYGLSAKAQSSCAALAERPPTGCYQNPRCQGERRESSLALLGALGPTGR